MARRRKNSNDGSGAGALLIVAIVAAVFVVKLAISILVCALLPSLALVWLGSWRSKGPPMPRSPTEFDNSTAWGKIESLSDRRRLTCTFIGQQYAVGFENNLTLTAKSEETLFHAGSRLGKQLNSNLGQGFDDLNTLANEIRSLRWSVIETFPDWRTPISRWVLLKRLNIAAGDGIALGIMIAILFTYTSLIPSELSNFAEKLFLWQLPFEVQKGPLVLAAILTIVLTGTIYLMTGLRQWKQIDQEVIREWETLESKWNWPIEDESFPLSSAEQPSDGRHDHEDVTDFRNEPEVKPWYVILGVSQDATGEEIKKAYRETIRQYHPDRVSGLGLRLREVAEEESKNINAAFAEARAKRGFV